MQPARHTDLQQNDEPIEHINHASTVMQVPDDMPSECPFEVDWTPGIVLVQVEKPLDEMAIKKGLLENQACKCMHILLEIAKADSNSSASDLSSRIQQVRAEVGLDGQLPAELLQQLCQSRWTSDRETDWQREWIRRQQAVATSTEAVTVFFSKLHAPHS